VRTRSEVESELAWLLNHRYYLAPRKVANQISVLRWVLELTGETPPSDQYMARVNAMAEKVGDRELMDRLLHESKGGE
jgi:uncharacterized protein with ATP-grasp and redox domains